MEKTPGKVRRLSISKKERKNKRGGKKREGRSFFKTALEKRKKWRMSDETLRTCRLPKLTASFWSRKKRKKGGEGRRRAPIPGMRPAELGSGTGGEGGC